ncbi:hypothetical protein AA0498_2862 [Acidomonas methanolica]|uniref:Uncharacterized protein n=1 Tax=Acidomonas methanolica NBRC 104435 TaxID=1231351 RepID=A0A023D7X4_ACIMT|nr:hypothetical protein Amme_085_024 [Acidomonas methanolica NBRC 104435]GBQ60546.1 hypothetical protein AA0498_2862 [Acidomonas methanolica]GEK98227.1 hypothetical protein AME01nite_07260 [Acidomonas methanolica NBRC 104435]
MGKGGKGKFAGERQRACNRLVSLIGGSQAFRHLDERGVRHAGLHRKSAGLIRHGEIVTVDGDDGRKKRAVQGDGRFRPKREGKPCENRCAYGDKRPRLFSRKIR